MLIVLAIAGFVTLLAIIYCIRLMRRGMTTLSSDKERWRKRFAEEEQRLSKEQSDIPLSEQMHLLYVGVQDLLRLEDLNEAECSHQDGYVMVKTTKGAWKLSFEAREQTLKSLKKVLHGPSHWFLERLAEPEQDEANLKQGEAPTLGLRQEYASIALLMQAFQAQLRGESLEELHFRPLRQHRLR